MSLIAIDKAVFAPLGQGPLALAPQAFGMAFDVVAIPVKPEAQQDAPKLNPEDLVRCVMVRGPLMHHADPKFLSYEVIAMVVGWQIMSGAKAIVLDIDSPGGLVAGCFETARKIQKMCRDAGVRLVGYIDGQCASAAYALACVCDEVIAPEASTTGSIGVLDVLSETTKKAAQEGVTSVLLTSGARKSDGNPLVEITPEAIAAKQAHVDDLAEIFFAHVAAGRPMKAAAVRALEAAQFSGAKAQALGLVDRVADFDTLKKELVALVTPRNDQEAKPALLAGIPLLEGKAPMASAARKALQAIADDKDSSDEDKKEARAGLKAMGDDGDDDKKKKDAEAKAAADDEDKKKKDAEAKAKAEGDDDKKDEKKDEEEAKARAAANPTLAALAEHQALKTSATASDDDTRKALIASRPDFTPALAMALATEPLGVVRHYVRTIPKGQSPMAASLAGARAAATPTPAAKPNAPAPVAVASGGHSAPEVVSEMDARMGVNAGTPRALMSAAGDEQIFTVAGHSAK